MDLKPYSVRKFHTAKISMPFLFVIYVFVKKYVSKTMSYKVQVTPLITCRQLQEMYALMKKTRSGT